MLFPSMVSQRCRNAAVWLSGKPSAEAKSAQPMCPFLLRTVEMVAVRDDVLGASAAARDGYALEGIARERPRVRAPPRICPPTLLLPYKACLSVGRKVPPRRAAPPPTQAGPPGASPAPSYCPL